MGQDPHPIRCYPWQLNTLVEIWKPGIIAPLLECCCVFSVEVLLLSLSFPLLMVKEFAWSLACYSLKSFWEQTPQVLGVAFVNIIYLEFSLLANQSISAFMLVRFGGLVLISGLFFFFSQFRGALIYIEFIFTSHLIFPFILLFLICFPLPVSDIIFISFWIKFSLFFNVFFPSSTNPSISISSYP